MKRSRVLLIAACVAVWLLASLLKAQVPQLINYQGVLRDPNTGSPISATQSMTFSIYSVPSGGTAVWSEVQSVEVNDGHFSVLLGSTTPIPVSVFSGGDRYLGVKVENDPEMTPRKRMVSVGYAFTAYDADKVDGQELSSNDGAVNEGSDPVSWFKIKDIPAGFADGTDDVGTAGGISQINVGTGMSVTNPTGPTATLNLRMGHNNNINADMVDGKHASKFAAAAHDHVGEVWSGSGLGLQVTMSGSNSSAIVGTIGPKHSTSNNGVYGESATGAGVQGFSTDGSGVYGKSVKGIEYTFGYLGGQHEGVRGEYPARNTYGILGGVYAGVRGYAYYDNYQGVYGYSEFGTGVYGYSSSGYAGKFSGKVRVTGYLEKAGGGFKIDHPLDPANKYLNHSFVESPDMMNVYNGNVTLDANGEAVVELPEWFEALNKDFRYQLTCIGGFAPVYIAEEISGNRFRIAGGSPGMKVSWQVTGIRQDAWANAHRISAEEEKPVAQQSKYLHPVEHGKPENLGMDYERIHRVKVDVK